MSGFGSSLHSPTGKPPKKNFVKKISILYIHSHDTGRHIEPYGYGVPTPNMMRLAKEGVLFRKHFTPGPTCSPSRAALLTGQMPHNCGMYGLSHRGWDLNDYGEHMIHTLKRAGYRTALCGVQHIIMDDREPEIGYDEILDYESKNAEHIAPVAVEWLNRHADDDQPFFLSVGMNDTHRGQGDFHRMHSFELDDQYCRPPEPIADTPETRKDMAAYVASAKSYDWAVGEVLRALDENGLAENTLVINTTDHGLAFPGMKCNLNDHGTGIMLIMRGPGAFSGGKVIDAMTSHIDIFPTLCDLLDLPVPQKVQGRSFLPVVRGEKESVNDRIFGEINWHVDCEPMRSVRTERWLYIRRFEERSEPSLANTDGGPSRRLWEECGWQRGLLATEQLYDNLLDPQQLINRAGSPEHQAVLSEMRTALECWMKETDDPLLDGKLPQPQPF